MKYLITLSLLGMAAWLFGQNPGQMKAIPERIFLMEKSGLDFPKAQPFQEILDVSRISVPPEFQTGAVGLVPNLNILTSIQKDKPARLSLVIPGVDGEPIIVHLHRTEVMSAQGEIRIASGGVITDVPGAFYRGIVKGDYESLVAISCFDDHIRGFISMNNRNYVLGPLEPMMDRNTHILYDDYLIKHLNPFECHMEDTAPDPEFEFDPTESGQRAPGDCVKIWWEVDHDIFNNKGGMAGTISWMTGMKNEVYTLYDNEALIMETSVMNIWDVPSPYTGNNSSARLSSFQSQNGVLDGDLAHYVNLTAGYGGVAAGFSGICNANYDASMCYSGLQTTYQNVPTYSWTIMVCTHEKGHLLGSRHTHACVWNGNNTAIDGCSGFTEGSCPIPGQPAGGGTIMSYCHQNVGINFNLGFGPQPGNVIRNTINNASCLDDCGLNGDCTFTITCPANTTVQCGPNPLPGVTGNATVTITSGSCNPTLNWTDNNNGLTGCNGTGFFIRTFTATDGISTASCAQTITKIDNVPPTISGVPNDITINCLAPVPNPANPTATDNCGVATLTFSETTGGGGNICGYTIIRTWTATDACNNQSMRTQILTVADTSPPEARCKDAEVFINNSGEAPLNPGMFDDGSFDACTTISLSVSPTSVTCAQLGNTTVTLIVEDACGNVATCNATVNVRDALKPKMACKGLELEVDELGTPMNITWQDIDDGSTDNCGIVEWNLSLTEFGCHNLGSNTVKAYAIDASGNTNECQVTVLVRDLIPPVFTHFPEDVTVYCDEGSATDVPTAEDNCGVVGITMEDAQYYWAEGPANSYRVSREWRATDQSGRTIVQTQWVSVLSEGQMITLCNKDIQMPPSKAPVQVTWNAPRVDDVCLGTFNMTLIDGPPSGSYFNPDSRTRITYEYIDAYATRHQCAFDVIVPGIEDDYQVKINQGVVPCNEYELQSCAVTDLSNPLNYSFTWRAPGSLSSTTFSLTGQAEFAVYADGTARLTGTWANGTDGWIGDLWFYHRRDVEGWNAVGGKIFNPLGMATDAWRFFEIDPLRSTLEGTGSNAGTTFKVTSSVLYKDHGLQLGAGANGATTAMGGWLGVTTFSQNNKWNGTGEFTFGMSCNNTGRILNGAEVIALNGANIQVNWGGGNTTEFLGDVVPGTYTVNVTDANGQVQSHTIRLDAPENCINLWQDACRERNKTKGSIANQGSTWNGAMASRAIDGNTDGDFANGSVTSTLAGWQNFWQAELTEVMDISGIRIWPRTDCCQSTLDPYYVFVSNSPIPDVAPEALLNRTDITAVRHEGPMDEAWRTGIETTGKYIKVQLAESGRLQLAEIEVLVCQPDRLDPPTNPIVGIGINPGSQDFGDGSQHSLKVWPNPGSDQVNVYLKVETAGQKVLRIYDMWGREMLRDTWTDQGERQFDIPTALWPQGMYKLHVQSEEGVVDQTILIQR